MSDKDSIFVGSNIRDAIKKISENGKQIVCLVNESNIFLGTISDGDIRRGLLRGLSLEDDVDSIVQRNSFTVSQSEREVNSKIQAPVGVTQIPILNSNREFIKLMSIKEIDTYKYGSIPVVIMAGGKGERLKPLTDSVPKPMLKIGDKPILEKLIIRLVTQGFQSFTIIVNYLADEIIRYFGNGKNFGAEIRFIRESEFRGTAGSLSQIDDKNNQHFLIINSDLLTDVDFRSIVDFHNLEDSEATVCVSNYEISIPFGVVSQNNGVISKIVEKPRFNFFISAGIYLISGELLNKIPKNGIFNMPDLMTDFFESGIKVNAFPIHENWVDIGNHEDFIKAQNGVSL